MKIETTFVEEMTIEQFADKHNLVMEVSEREYSHLPKFFASFKETWVSEPPMIVGTHGNGNTIKQAIEEYAQKISLKTLKIKEEYVKVPRMVPAAL